MVAGGMTQYFAKVQIMPRQVEEILTKTIRNFMWNDKKPFVNMGTFSLLVAQRGIKLLNLKVRNQAIKVMWLKSYLNLGPKRPL
jgi:hypothetical protein